MGSVATLTLQCEPIPGRSWRYKRSALHTVALSKEPCVHPPSNIYFILAATKPSGDRIVLLYTQYEYVIVLCAEQNTDILARVRRIIIVKYSESYDPRKVEDEGDRVRVTGVHVLYP